MNWLIWIKNTPLALLVATLFVVSAAREVALFTSFAAGAAEWGLAAAFAVALVMGKLVLSAHGTDQAVHGHPWLAAACAGLTVPLLAISVAGTALYFESAYITRADTEKQADTGWQVADTLIREKLQSIEELKALAKAEKAKGNTWMAGQHQLKASEIENTLPDLMDRQLREQTASSAATIAGDGLQDWRWLAWGAVALLADLIQLLGVVLLTQKRTQDEPDGWLQRQVQAGRIPTVRQAQALGINYRRYKKELDALAEAGVVVKAEKGWEVV